MLAPEVDGLRTLSFCSLGLSPFEITNEPMAAMISGEENGTGVDLYYATLAKAVAKVKDGGAITLIEPVQEDLAPADKTYTVVASEEVWSRTEMKVGGEPVASQDGNKVTITPMLSGSVSGNTLTYTVSGAPRDAKLIAARYDGGRMTWSEVLPLNGEPATLRGSGETVKLFLLDSATPEQLCAAWSNDR